MKPRTKLQHEVVNNSKQLINIENKMLSWAKKHVLEHKGFATKNRVICMDCAGTFPTTLVKRKRATCSHCKAKLTIEESRKTTLEQHIYVAMAEIYGEFQVIRNFEIRSYHNKYRQYSKEPVRYYVSEICQHWILPNGKMEIYAQLHTSNMLCDSWSGEMAIRDKSPGWYGNKYDFYVNKYHPDSVFQSQYKKMGIDKDLENISFLEVIKKVPLRPQYETLLKAKQYDLLGYFIDKGNVHQYWQSVKICMRNKYKITDASIWCDYIDLLRYLNKDTHNAHYVCPKNLKKQHDIYVAKKRREQQKREDERNRKQALENEKLFKELKADFFGICFGDDKIMIKVLESVQEHLEEGDKLHHCVFTNQYFLKKKSLILSARINNEPVETIEVNIEKFKIEQSRGLQNKNSDYHDRIIELVNKNMSVIRKRKTAKKKLLTA
ncbi:MAG: PcfJ domain-containing protein [Paludibacteraceae bacterium]|nr:PcfJ domain-containing protein [Paludibacteraceae bacterium]